MGYRTTEQRLDGATALCPDPPVLNAFRSLPKPQRGERLGFIVTAAAAAAMP